MAFICSSCSASFRSEHALATHRPHCKKIVPNLGGLLKRKREAAALQAERQNRQRFEADESMEVDEGVAPVLVQEEVRIKRIIATLQAGIDSVLC